MTLSAADNERLTRVGPGTPMGTLLRRYWWPFAAATELEQNPIKPVRLFGEDLVLYRDRSGTYGLVDRVCPHRGASLLYGMVEECGLRCAYHGWRYDEKGACIEQPFERTVRPDARFAEKVRLAAAYRVREEHGVLFAYLGPDPAPCLPDWDRFHTRGFKHIAITELPCNWLQCQENALDPVHFEWLHLNWSQRQRGEQGASPRHLEIGFDEFEYGFVYRRLLEGGSKDDELWKIGRVCLWPNCLYAGAFDWNVPIDDENTLRLVWMVHPLPGDAPFQQEKIPHWRPELYEPSSSRFHTARWTNQDFAITASQGRIADRTREHLGESDRGVILMRKRFLADLDVVAAGGDPKGILRDESRNVRIPLPLMSDQTTPQDEYVPPPLEGQPPELALEIQRVWQRHRA